LVRFKFQEKQKASRATRTIKAIARQTNNNFAGIKGQKRNTSKLIMHEKGILLPIKSDQHKNKEIIRKRDIHIKVKTDQTC